MLHFPHQTQVRAATRGEESGSGGVSDFAASQRRGKAVKIWSGDDSIKITLLYLPKLVVKGEGAFRYIANGEIAEHWFRGRRK